MCDCLHGSHQARAHTRAAVCTACVGRRANCPASGQPVTLHVHGLACPRGRHPDRRGVTRRWWVRWHGLNALERAWLAARYGRAVVAGLPGCGCVVRIKRWWRLARLVVRRARRSR